MEMSYSCVLALTSVHRVSKMANGEGKASKTVNAFTICNNTAESQPSVKTSSSSHILVCLFAKSGMFAFCVHALKKSGSIF